MNTLSYKILASICLLFNFMTPAMADNGGTSIADAIRITEGNYHCSYKPGDTYETAWYYVYKATDTGILSLSGNNGLVFTPVDTDEKEIGSVHGAGTCQVPMKEGMEVYLKAYPNITLVENDTTMTFTTSFIHNDNACKGISKDDPIILADNGTNYCINTTGGYDGFATYLTYTATDDGVLSLRCTGYMVQKQYGDSFDNLNHDFSSEYDTGGYVGTIPVKAGETTCIKITLYQSSVITCSMIHPERGTKEYPWEAVTGDNKVPGEFGDYYYNYTNNVGDGYLVISSEQLLPRGYVELYSTDDMYYPIARSVAGEYSMRIKTKIGAEYNIHVYKVEDSEEEDEDYNPLPDTFTITIENSAEGDTPDRPILLQPCDETVTKTYSGTYYYAVDIPETSVGQLLEVTLIGDDIDNTGILVYGSSFTPYASVPEQKQVKTVVTPGARYTIMLYKDNASTYTLRTVLRDIVEGEAITKPITAIIGTNTVQKGNDIYYKYTATQTGRLTLRFNIPGVGVDFPTSEEDIESYPYTTLSTSYLIDVKSGTTYLFHITNVIEDTTFELSEHEYGEGESVETAIPVTGAYIVMPSGQASLWYRYDVTMTGKLIISSEEGFYGDGSTIAYYVTETDRNPYYINNGDGEGNLIFYATKDVVEGDVIYVHITTPGNFGGKKINCYVRDYETGETINTPYIMTRNSNVISDIPAASRNQYRWIKIDTKGISTLTLTTDRFVAGGIYEGKDISKGYAATFTPDADNVICTATYHNTGNLDTVYVCFEMTGGTICLTGSFETISGITGIIADDSADNRDAYNILGQKVSASAKGIVIKNGKKMVR